MVVDINSEDTYEKSEREIVNMGEQTSIDYITNYFVSTDENAISKEALLAYSSWTTILLRKMAIEATIWLAYQRRPYYLKR